MIPWSYSFLRDFANCPQKAYRKYVARDLPKETSPELEEGIRVHEMLESYINEPKPKMLLSTYEPYVAPLIQQGARAEVKLGMTKDMRPADFFGAFHRVPLPYQSLYEPLPEKDPPVVVNDLWGRGKADVLILKPPMAFIVDWKTGKTKEDDRELRQLALLVRANYPEITRISGCYVWLKEDKMGKIYDLSDVNRVYHGTVAQMEEAQRYEREDEWPVTPNPLCSWCPVADCRFNSNPRLGK